MKIQFEVTESQLRSLEAQKKPQETLADTIRRLLFRDGTRNMFEEIFGGFK